MNDKPDEPRTREGGKPSSGAVGGRGSGTPPIRSEQDMHGIRSPGQPPEAEAPAFVEPPTASLPKGGGALKGIGETFTVNPANGTCKLQVPLPVTAARGFEPSLSLQYDSGAANGAFGLGWSASTSRISRRTDRGIPRYFETGPRDTYLLPGVEDLVEAVRADGTADELDRTENATAYHVVRYRPRIEGAFARIERWIRSADGDIHWRVTAPDNRTSVFGDTAESRIADPDDARRVFAWLLARSYNDRGELCLYRYKAEDSAGVPDVLHEHGRTVGAERYLKRVQYGFQTPFDPDSDVTPADNCFEVVLDYGDHDPDDPRVGTDRPWPVRPDPFSVHRSGFEVRTYRLCHRVLLFHHFAELGAAPTLVRSMRLGYVAEEPGRADEGLVASFLGSITLSGHATVGGARQQADMPALLFGYTDSTLKTDIQVLSGDDLDNLPAGIADGIARLADLDGEGIAGILTEQSGAWYYRRGDARYDPANATPPRVSYQPLTAIASLPAGASLGQGWRLMDVGGDGQLSLVYPQGPAAGCFERNDTYGFEGFRPFRFIPVIDRPALAVDTMDVDGDGVLDRLRVEDGRTRWWRSLGRDGFSGDDQTWFDGSSGEAPYRTTGEKLEALLVADMNGDGLSDLLLIQNSAVTYWPNRGYGRFANPVRMSNPPLFDETGRFDPARIRLGDVDGSGTTDLLYLHPAGPRLYRNRAGNSFGPAEVINGLPTPDQLVTADLVDLMGTGTACLVWSTTALHEARTPLRYVDLMGSRKPHLLNSLVNNLGAETRLRYAPSTKFYLADREAGRPWLTRLPFPVQVIETLETRDYIGDTHVVTHYTYHHGLYDRAEREFRGFGRVEQRDAEAIHGASGIGLFTDRPPVTDGAYQLPPVRTVTWFHTGVFLGRDRVARGFESEYWAGDAAAAGLADTDLLPGLDGDERREASRALKGLPLRTEIYAEDGTAQANTPYSVTEHAYRLELVQPRGDRPHAVLLSWRSETLTAHYECDPTDPRVGHEMILVTDPFGTPLQTAEVAYPRRPRPDRLPEQAALAVTVTEAQVAHLATLPNAYRLRIPIESRSWEISGVPPGASGLFSPDALLAAWPGLPVNAPETPIPPGASARRLIQQARSYYRSDDLTTRLPLGTVEPLALNHETLTLAFSAGLITNVFGARVPPAVLAEGGYVQDGGPGWWIPSGRVFHSPNPLDPPAAELAEARAHFFLPRRFRDAFGSDVAVSYTHDIAIARITDAIGNQTTVRQNWRVMAPDVITDPNGNRTAVRFDPLGMVTAGFVLGRSGGTDGDVFDDASAEVSAGDDPSETLSYDLFAFRDRGKPASARTRTRERHRDAASPWQEAWGYSDGFGRLAMRKLQAEGGLAPLRDPGGDLLRDGSGNLVLGPVAERWVGSGRTIFGNKGQPIKQYEPFFDSGPQFITEDELATTGVTALQTYDPLGRLVSSELPNGTVRRVAFTPWTQETWDENDTVTTSRWYADRGSPSPVAPEPADPETRAAWLAAAHDSTPTRASNDPLGRSILIVGDDGPDPGGGPRRLFSTRSMLSVQGHVLAVQDALGRTIMLADHDMVGRRLRHRALDGDDSLMFPDVGGKAIRVWTRAGYAARTKLDALRRPVRVWVASGGGAERLVERTVYGETHPDATRNLRGRTWRRYGDAGLAETVRYDFKNNIIEGARRFPADHRTAPDWAPLAALQDPATLDAASTGLLSAEIWRRTQRFDAMNRVVQTVGPAMTAMRPSVIQPRYTRANLLLGVDVWLRMAAAPAGVLGPSTADRAIVTVIEYNARGQRLRVAYGNGSETRSTYDPLTARLSLLETARPTGFPVAERTAQRLLYTYDPIGNVVRIADQAQDSIFFRNRQVDPGGRYAYTPLYRLASATGREHLGLAAGGGRNPPAQPGESDSFRTVPHPHDGNAVAPFVEQYRYDGVGNILDVTHVGDASGGWTRRYAYNAPSVLEAGRVSNLLTATSLPGDPAAGPYSDAYGYDVHGNLTAVSHLTRLDWDHEDRLVVTARQAAGAGQVPETTFYAYAGATERGRKATDWARPAAAAPSLRRDCLYLDGFEVTREYAADGTPSLVRETLHVSDGERRIAIIETKTLDTDDRTDLDVPLVRYQYSNQLGSILLELDDTAQIITHEEYFPFGGTSMLLQSAAIRAAAKRYRYANREKDAENGFYYYGARYYAPWIGRWVSPDPAGITDGPNRYAFVGNNPVGRTDRGGKQGENSIDDLFVFIRNTAGFSTGQRMPPTFNSASASPFGTAAHAEATQVLDEMKAIVPDADRIFSEVRVEGGVITQIGGTPGGAKGALNLDLVAVAKGQTLATGQPLGPGGAEVVGDLKYGGGKIKASHSALGQRGVTVNAKFNNAAGPMPASTAPASPAPAPAAPAAEAGTAAKTETALADAANAESGAAGALKTESTVAKVAEEVNLLSKEGEALVGGSKLIASAPTVAKIVSGGAKAVKVAAPVIKVAAPALKVVGKVAGPLGIGISAVQLATAKNTDERIDAGLDLTANVLLASPHPVAKAAGGGIIAGQFIEKNLNVSDYSSAGGIKVYESLKEHGVGETTSFVAGGVATVLLTVPAIGYAATDKLIAWWRK